MLHVELMLVRPWKVCIAVYCCALRTLAVRVTL